MPLEIRLVDESPSSAVFHVRELIGRLADSSRSVDEREEAAFRAVVDLLTDLRAASDHDLYSLVADRLRCRVLGAGTRSLPGWSSKPAKIEGSERRAG